ncbi:MAG: hypothetical protein EBX50_19560, partial [Chitinophagia bacterium]|nr:hypothetical protein [Chitinophagia bacterium]
FLSHRIVDQATDFGAGIGEQSDSPSRQAVAVDFCAGLHVFGEVKVPRLSWFPPGNLRFDTEDHEDREVG